MFLTLVAVMVKLMTLFQQKRKHKTDTMLSHVKDIVSRKTETHEDLKKLLVMLKDSGIPDIELGEVLFSAVRMNDLDTATVLIQHGANVNYEDHFKQSPLMIAVINDHSSIIELLLDNGADINRINQNGQTDFMILMNSGKSELRRLINLLDNCKHLSEKDILSGGSFLHMVRKYVYDPLKPAMISRLIKRGLSVHDIDNNGDTPLHLLTAVACVDSIKILLANGADVNVRNRKGETALHYLAQSNELNGFAESLNVLIANGANVNELDDQGQSVFHHALSIKETTLESIKTFIQSGVAVNVRDIFGRNEFFNAVDSVRFSARYTDEDVDRRLEIIKYLIELGADINNGDNLDITPLHLASRKNSLTLLVGLIDLGADISRRTKTGALPLHWACANYNMVHVLVHIHIETGVDINIQDEYGSTALHWAIWFRNDEAVQTLLQAGADDTIVDSKNETPSILSKRLQYGSFSFINEHYEELEGLELESGNQLPCVRTDDLFACPQLRSIKEENGHLDLNFYLEHVKLHTQNVKHFKDVVLGSLNMGFYYEVDENIDVQELIKDFVNEVAKKVTSKHPLFKCELVLAGSLYEETKVCIPDEFDYIWYLVEFENAFVSMYSSDCPSGYIKFHVLDDDFATHFRRFINNEGFLDCGLVLREFYSCVNNEVIELLCNPKGTRFRNLLCQQFLNEISASLSSLNLCFFGPQAKLMTVSLDVVPSIRINGTQIGAITETVLTKHYKAPTCQVAAVFKTPDRYNVRDFSLFFRLSFASLEQSIIRVIPDEAKKGYILLKSLIESFYLPHVISVTESQIKQLVTSYRLKTCLMHALEDAINDGGVDSGPLQWSKRIVCTFENFLEKQNLPTYFDARKNLFSPEGMKEGITGKETYSDLLTILKHLLLVMDTYTNDVPQLYVVNP